VEAIGFMQREIQERPTAGSVRSRTSGASWSASTSRHDESRWRALCRRPGCEQALAERVARVARVATPTVRARARRAGDGRGGRANLMPLIVDAVEQAATLGEICHRLRACAARTSPP